MQRRALQKIAGVPRKNLCMCAVSGRKAVQNLIKKYGRFQRNYNDDSNSYKESSKESFKETVARDCLTFFSSRIYIQISILLRNSKVFQYAGTYFSIFKKRKFKNFFFKSFFFIRQNIPIFLKQILKGTMV
jgi:hypothetical protein